jgi:hypothetical protein
MMSEPPHSGESRNRHQKRYNFRGNTWHQAIWQLCIHHVELGFGQQIGCIVIVNNAGAHQMRLL